MVALVGPSARRTSNEGMAEAHAVQTQTSATGAAPKRGTAVAVEGFSLRCGWM